MSKKSNKGLNSLFKMTGFAVKVATAASKAAKKESLARQRHLEKIQRQNIREQQRLEKQRLLALKRIEQERFVAEQKANGFEYVAVRSLDKYMPIMPGEDFKVIEQAGIDGVNKVFIHQDKIAELNARLKIHKEKTRALNKCAELNNIGKIYEQDGDVAMAIQTYEKNIKLGYPAHHSYKRLMILYSRNGDFENERRVIERALEVFPDYEEYANRLKKNKLKK